MLVRLSVDSPASSNAAMGNVSRASGISGEFVKIHMLADADTKKMPAIQATDDINGNPPSFIPLFDETDSGRTVCQTRNPHLPAEIDMIINTKS